MTGGGSGPQKEVPNRIRGLGTSLIFVEPGTQQATQGRAMRSYTMLSNREFSIRTDPL